MQIPDPASGGLHIDNLNGQPGLLQLAGKTQTTDTGTNHQYRQGTVFNCRFGRQCLSTPRQAGHVTHHAVDIRAFHHKGGRERDLQTHCNLVAQRHAAQRIQAAIHQWHIIVHDFTQRFIHRFADQFADRIVLHRYGRTCRSLDSRNEGGQKRAAQRHL